MIDGLFESIAISNRKLTQGQFDYLTEQSRNTFVAKVLCDTLHPVNGSRLTTVELTYPRIVHSEFMTHRMFSRNSASSRAIPMEAMLLRIHNNPFFPLHWGKKQKGMQASEELSPEERLSAGARWIDARNAAINHAQSLKEIGIHKQIGNRITEPWMWITVIASGCTAAFENFFALRCHPDAEPHIQLLAYKLREAYDSSVPQTGGMGDWHLPLIDKERDCDIPVDDLPMISAGRCARVSYLTHDGIRSPEADLRLANDLTSKIPVHASPLEHVAKIVDPFECPASNFDAGFFQLRKGVANECIRRRQSNGN